ncbi:conserved Plasmodium protein, unknown function [Plasmodium relictum]|uniref:Uncharacterized protein n=1 Tax=Plasmodium relictum TaxID=85471 RepID=A0A1J1HAM8_PLARL|nr:conserved Plasmodium protein, unknown function [Plasmodium relictum]CRH02529.1 conserved Plasmodium protein, unknown function [Plasmodium relictum]
MYNALIFLFLFINYCKNASGTISNGKDQKNNKDDSLDIDDKWILYDLETNPYIDLRHPNFKGDFIRTIDEYYVYETKEYNAYKKERYNNLMNNKEFEKKQFNCVISFLIHGRPNSREVNDYKIWSSQANIIKNEAMSKQKYSKFISYAPFISCSNFLGSGGVHSHVHFAYITALRISMTLKNLISDDTCYNYDVFFHSHCFGANIIRMILSLNNDIWKIMNIPLINLDSERNTLSILEDNFKLTLTNINIITDKDSIKVNKDPYFKGLKYYLYNSFQVNLRNKKLTEQLDEIFNDEDINYNDLNEDMLKDTNINYNKSYDIGNRLNRVIKRLHYYLLNKKINLLNITSTAPPLSGVVWKLEDIKIGHQKKVRFKNILKIIPSFIKHRILKTRDVEELLYITNPQLFCLLSVEEKVDYDYNKNRGSLISYFKNVSYYSDLDNDELVSMYTSLGLHSPAHMRSLSYYMLNFRNEYYNRVFKIPAHLSNINVSDNGYIIDYIQRNDVCSYVKPKYLEYFVSYVNELVNYNQKPAPYIPQRLVYKNPFLIHFKVPVNQKNNIYTSHSILGTGRTALLLYSYDIYKHISESGFSNKNALENELDNFYDIDPFIYYNWMTYVGNQTERTKEKFMKDLFLYSDNINMNIVENLFNMFTSSHYLKFFIFHIHTKVNSIENLYKIINRFSLPKFNTVLGKKEIKKIKLSLLKSNELNKKEKQLYDYFSIYTNFLKNFSYNNAVSYIPQDSLLNKHKDFKEYQNKNINSLKEELRKIHKFVQENKTFYQMKKKLKHMHNIKGIDNMVSDDKENEEIYDEFENYNDIENVSDYRSMYSSDEGRVNNYSGMYFHIKRSLSLKNAFQNIRATNTLYNNVQYIEFVIKSAKLENVEDNLNDLKNTNYCLFNYDDKFSLSYIVNFCNYNQEIYSNIKKYYTSNSIYVLENLKDCNLKKYKNLKLCENSILLKKLFHTDLDTVLSNLHYKEFKRMIEMKKAIEKGINKEDIFSLSNDSLVTILHSRNGNITNFQINVCFKVYDVSSNKDLFFRDDKAERESDDQNDSSFKKSNSVFCTHVNLPVKIDHQLIKSLNNIYMRAIHNIMENNQFQNEYGINEPTESYKSFVYFFNKFSYVYNLKDIYENENDINLFSTPQNIKWDQFYNLLNYEINTDFNNEQFLQNFFYDKKTVIVKPFQNNILKDFLMHFTVFFYLFKVNSV